jgi:hypothetical protein
MTRRARADGARTVNDRARCRRNARAQTMTPRVDAAMNSTPAQVEDEPGAVEGDGAGQRGA